MPQENTKMLDQVNLQLNKGYGSQLGINANIHIELFDEKGSLKDDWFVHNTVTTAGKAGVADQIIAAPTLTKMGWMAVGTGTPQATLLQTETARVAFDTKTRSGAVVTVVATFAAGTATGAITEAATFDVVTANTVNMWMSASFAAVNKAAGDTLVITWSLTVS